MNEHLTDALDGHRIPANTVITIGFSNLLRNHCGPALPACWPPIDRGSLLTVGYQGSDPDNYRENI